MTEHPIIPPPELVQQWDDEGTAMFRPEYQQHLTACAAQWGADQELEACCEWLVKGAWFSPDGDCLKGLCAARRPKPPSLKEQALEQLRRVNAVLQFQTTGGETSVIRRALEALPND